MPNSGALHGVLVTFRRPVELGLTLQRLAEQTTPLDMLVVVDNDNDPRAKAEVEASPDAARSLEYVPAPENLGPAGGLALGASRLLQTAGDADWVVFLDDDNPPRTADMFSLIVGFAAEMQRCDPSTAAVGTVGARFDRRRGLVVRLADHELVGAVPVDCIGGGNFPCYRASAMRAVGLPDPRLFFGYDDLEYGLRYRAAAWQLYVDGATWARERRAWGRMGITPVPSRTLQPVDWRDYYCTRNIVWMLRKDGHRLTAARFIARRLAKALYNAPRRPATAWGNLRLGVRATLDAHAGRMGRTLEPSIPHPAPSAHR